MQQSVPKMSLGTPRVKSALAATASSIEQENAADSVALFVEEITDTGLEGFADVSKLVSEPPINPISMRV